MKAAAPAPAPAAPRLWDIFCHVIDNWGDLGVCWRLARQLVAHRQRVRLWVDDASALSWMASPGALQGPGPSPRSSPSQASTSAQPLYQGLGELAELSVHPWPRLQPETAPPTLEPGDVLIEAFGCSIAPHWVQALQPEGRAGQVWINLEYLSAEPWTERCHGLPSPVLSGPLAGRCKWFYYPGFSAGTGGLLGEHCPAGTACSLHDSLDTCPPAPVPTAPSPWLPPAAELRVLLFCYQAPALPALLADPALAQAHWLLTAGRAQAAWRTAGFSQNHTNQPLNPAQTTLLPLLAQTEFDALLRTCHLNFVRGEDSLVSALWAGQPLVWQIYPQDDGAHHAKLEAFLDWLAAPPCLRHWHRVWNGLDADALPTLDAARLRLWADCIGQARQRLRAQDDLVRQLLRFVTAHSAPSGA